MFGTYAELFFVCFCAFFEQWKHDKS